jgi:hypothetical protein
LQDRSSAEKVIFSRFGGDNQCPTEFDRPLTDVLAWTGVKLILLGISLKAEWSEAAAENEDDGRRKIGWEYLKDQCLGEILIRNIARSNLETLSNLK